MQVRPLTALSDGEITFRDSVFRWATAEIGPRVAHMDETATMAPEVLQGVFDMGLMGIEVPEAYDGLGAKFFDAILVIEALARVDPSVSVLVDVQNTLVNNAFKQWGTEAQKQTYLRQLATSKVGAYALSEPASGSDAFALKCRAEDAGDHWVLNGTKLWITNAKEASFFILMANVDPSKGYRGITSFIVEKGFEGFSVGKKEDKLGIRASSTCELVLDNCKVPKENVLGEIGKGYKIAIETLNEGRIGIGAQMLGLAQGAFDYAMKYMLERKQFGRPIAEFQGMEFQYAQLATDIEAARLMVYNAARLKDAGMPFVHQAAMAKLYASQVAERTASLCVEFAGGVGFTKEYPLEKYFRDSKIGKIYEGTSNMQLATIAKTLRKVYASKG